MGINDREYVRQQPQRRGFGPGGGGPSIGSPKGWSINAWIIAINIAVAVIGGATANLGIPVLRYSGPATQPSDPSAVISDSEFKVSAERFAPADLRRQSGIGLIKQWGDASNARVLGPKSEQQDVRLPQGLAVFENPADDSQLIVAPVLKTDQYEVMDPLRALGHFSTAKVFVDPRPVPGGVEWVLSLELWRLLTFQFLHAGFWHLAFNMFGLFVFGGIVEQYLGRNRYLAFYLISGACGGLMYLLLNFAGKFLGIGLPGVLIGDIHTPLVGASAGVFGVIMAAAFLAPNAIVQLLFPPIPLKLKWLAYGYVGLALYNLLSGGQNAGGDAAHIGGAIAGAYFIRNKHRIKAVVAFFDPLTDIARSLLGRGKPRQGKSPKGAPNQAEVDRILAKVSERGIHSLTQAEKDVLSKASEDA